MSWAKESAKVGLAGLTPLEAAKGGHVFARVSGHARPSEAGAHRNNISRGYSNGVSK